MGPGRLVGCGDCSPHSLCGASLLMKTAQFRSSVPAFVSGTEQQLQEQLQTSRLLTVGNHMCARGLTRQEAVQAACVPPPDARAPVLRFCEQEDQGEEGAGDRRSPSATARPSACTVPSPCVLTAPPPVTDEGLSPRGAHCLAQGPSLANGAAKAQTGRSDSGRHAFQPTASAPGETWAGAATCWRGDMLQAGRTRLLPSATPGPCLQCPVRMGPLSSGAEVQTLGAHAHGLQSYPLQVVVRVTYFSN